MICLNSKRLYRRECRSDGLVPSAGSVYTKKKNSQQLLLKELLLSVVIGQLAWVMRMRCWVKIFFICEISLYLRVAKGKTIMSVFCI